MHICKNKKEQLEKRGHIGESYLRAPHGHLTLHCVFYYCHNNHVLFFIGIFIASDALEEDSLDALDAYMSAIKAGAMDTKTKMNLKRRLLELRGEQQRIQKLANIAKPALPKLQM